MTYRALPPTLTRHLFDFMAEGLRPPLRNSSAPRDKEPKELGKLHKWQEDRIARKLKGEYESAILHLSEVVCCVFAHFVCKSLNQNR